MYRGIYQMHHQQAPKNYYPKKKKSLSLLMSLSESTMQKAVFRLSIHDKRIRKKVLVTVSAFPGVNSIAMDEKSEKMTVIGEIDASAIVMKLRKICDTGLETVEPVKKPEPPKPEPPKPAAVPLPVMPMIHYPSYDIYHSPYPTYPNHYNARIVEGDDPNACVIC